jgi:hypothetical protein
LPAGEPLQVKVEDPEPPLMLVGDNVHDRLDELVTTPRVTTPEKPFRGVTVIVDVPLTRALTVILA